MQNINGVKKIVANENGRKIQINDDPNQGIVVTVTENGKAKKYEAKNADELKKKHPDGYKIYEKYSKNQMPPIRLQQLFPQAVQGRRNADILRRLADATRQLKTAQTKHEAQLKSMQADLNKALETLKQLEGDSADMSAEDRAKWNSAFKQLEQLKKQLETDR